MLYNFFWLRCDEYPTQDYPMMDFDTFDDAGVPHEDDQPLDATATADPADVMVLSDSPTPDRRAHFIHHVQGYYPDNQEGLSPSPKTTELDPWINTKFLSIGNQIMSCISSRLDSPWIVESQDSAETGPRLRRLDACDDLPSLMEPLEPVALFQEPLAIVSQSHRDRVVHTGTGHK